MSAGVATRTAVASRAVTAQISDSRTRGSGASRDRRGGVDGRYLRPGAPQSRAGFRGPGPLRDGAAVLRVAPAPLLRTRGGRLCFHSGFSIPGRPGALVVGGGGRGGGGERGGPGSGILTSPLRKTEVASRNPTCYIF